MTSNNVKTRSSQQNERGSVSVAFISFLLLLFSTLGFVSFSMMRSDSQLTARALQSLQARYLAEAGVEIAIKHMAEGDTLASSETVTLDGGSFTIQAVTTSDGMQLTSIGAFGEVTKRLRITSNYRPPISNFAIFSTGNIDQVSALDELGDPAPGLLVENAITLPDIDNDALIDTATAQSHVQTSDFTPSDGYPNYNFYYSGSNPNVTYVQGNMLVQGGRTIYGIYIVEGNITLQGSSRVEGVLYMTTPDAVIIHGGGNPSESSVTGGVVANGPVDGTGNHITIHYTPEYMTLFGEYENRTASISSIKWQEL